MRIATWNLQRLEKRKNQLILDKLIDINADILVLTETNAIIQPDSYTCISTDLLPANFDNIIYCAGENRVSILTKYKATARHKTFDSFTTVCTDIETPFGLLTVYGSIIGVFANRQPRFDNDLNGQLADFKKLFPGRQVCLAGDFNVTFSGRPWPSNKARRALVDAFNALELTNTTAGIADTVDHIVLSNDFLKNKHFEMVTWNADKKLSDHVGHLLILTP
ncbi:MAG TPA: endonuclease/exonuclease/phosphatase family protein [Prolixibacteraceae bacterium]|nr:endonuclease/exonuclease/phosphatase family protein [Prolixibacteraceae bacterium]